MTSKQSTNISENISEEGKKKRLANLKPFKPGETGNPLGKPKGKLNYDTRIDIALEVLAQKYVDDMNKKNRKKKGWVNLTTDDVDIEGDIYVQHLNKARNGNDKQMDSFFDRRTGKAKQPIELPGSIFNTPEYNKNMLEAQKKIDAFQKRWFNRKKSNA
jgi:hypothetical protein